MKAVLARFSLAANRQFIWYCIIGACGATLDFATFSALIKWVGLPLQAANALGYCVGLVWSFCLNAFFNFKTRDMAVLRFLSFCAVSLLGWASSAGILHIAVQTFHWNQYLAKLIAIVVVVLLQYNLNRLLSFRRTPDAQKTG